jgi:predicted regulator of Ras-like GTPase activity (Roadblock/LC7/MglB family)
MMTSNFQKKPELVQQELKALTDRIPEIVSVALITVDGLKPFFYSKDPRVSARENSGNEEESSFGPMGAAIVSLSEHISSRLGAGEWTFSVVAGNRGIIFEQAVDDESVIIAFAQPESSVDTILPELKATCERLLQL